MVAALTILTTMDTTTATIRITTLIITIPMEIITATQVTAITGELKVTLTGISST